MPYELRTTGSASSAKTLETIGLAIRRDDRLFAFPARLRVLMLHAHDPIKALPVQPFEDLLIVDLARSRLLTAGVVAHLHVRDLGPSHLEIRDQVPRVDLLVIKVV